MEDMGYAAFQDKIIPIKYGKKAIDSRTGETSLVIRRIKNMTEIRSDIFKDSDTTFDNI